MRSWELIFVVIIFPPNTWLLCWPSRWNLNFSAKSWVTIKIWLVVLQLTDFCMSCGRKTDTIIFLLFLLLEDLEPWDYLREMFLICCLCVSCHWGNCHEKTLDNSHDKQKYFDNSQSLDAAEEEPSETGTEEEPVLSVENSGRDSDALRLESKLIWPELCFWGKINSQALSLGFSLL